MSTTEVTQEELNLMAEMDGEPPFSLEVGAELGSQNETSAFKKAMTFSIEIKAALATGVADEAIPEDWIAMVQDFELEEPKNTAVPKDKSNFLTDVASLVQSFFRPSYAFGGAFAFAFGIALVVQINDNPQSWNDTYASLEGVPALQMADGSNPFSGDYFERPQIAVRGINTQLSPEESIARSLSLEEPFSIAPGQELDKLALSLQAAELNGKTFALVPAGNEKVWLSIRGTITAKDGEDRGDCKLVQVSLEKDGNPDLSVNNYFLQYCQQRWSNKIVPLG
ncbi:hypothetical protein N9K70_01150 [Pseudomonadales bacterium]|nr:hypothetical protein [Pseudomonadales bacterium]